MNDMMGTLEKTTLFMANRFKVPVYTETLRTSVTATARMSRKSEKDFATVDISFILGFNRMIVNQSVVNYILKICFVILFIAYVYICI